MIEIRRMELDWWKSSHLSFRDDGPVSPKAKTRQFSVFSSSNRALLGYVKWFPNWRKYCFYPLNSLFDDQCLEEIALFMAEATAVHMGRLPNKKRAKEMEQRRRKRRMERLTKKKESSTIGLESQIPESINQVVEGGGLAPEV